MNKNRKTRYKILARPKNHQESVARPLLQNVFWPMLISAACILGKCLPWLTGPSGQFGMFPNIQGIPVG